MIIKHDYSYIPKNENKLLDNGYGELTVHSINFDRYYTEEQMKQNRQKAETMTREEWGVHCNEVSAQLEITMEEVLNEFIDRYNIHQISPETSTMAHFKSDWDLYFYTNKGWNGVEYMNYFSLTFNENRTPEQNMGLLKEVIELIETLEYSNIACRIQYKAVIDKRRVEDVAKVICKNLVGKFIEYNGMKGKIKVVREENGKREYGFFKKNARSKYYVISYTEILAMNL